ncbi:MAG: metalloregulator ArsR/SmtB family transcription factor [Gorillibacterium sp.]|nr:metalloregulator ArsR/SmtB family transcription factor [Gorillibacterium sp.]
MYTLLERETFFRQNVKLFVSPWSEMITSLHVLEQPEHHPFRNQWAQRTLTLLPEQLCLQIHRLGSVSDHWLSLHRLEDKMAASLSVEELLQKLEQLPDAEFADLLFNDAHPLSEIWEAQHAEEKPGWVADLDADYAELIKNPLAVRSTMVTFVREYWNTSFRDEWRLIEPWLIADMKSFTDALEKSPSRHLGRLHPRLHITAEAIEAQKATLHRFSYSDLDQILIQPSTFIYPHLLIDFVDGTLTLPLHVQVPGEFKSDEVPADMVRLFKALADPNRLRMIRLLHTQPYCTQQLAQKLAISEAAVSKQLALLTEAGLLAAFRKGSYIFYSLRKEETEMTIVYLRQFLEQ